MKGYIVTGNQGGMMLTSYDDTPKGGILCFGNVVHVFATRRSANAAVARWRAYAEVQQPSWLTDDCPRVQRLSEAPR